RCLGGQGVAADRAVAGAQFVGLQGVDDAQRVFRRTADVQVGDIDVLDDVVRIDDEGRAQGHAFFFVQHAQGAGQLAAVVGELPDRQLVQVGVVAAPGQLGELIVGRTAQNHGVAVLEVLAQLGEGGDFGRADEGEVLRVEEDDLPL